MKRWGFRPKFQQKINSHFIRGVKMIKNDTFFKVCPDVFGGFGALYIVIYCDLVIGMGNLM